MGRCRRCLVSRVNPAPNWIMFTSCWTFASNAEVSGWLLKGGRLGHPFFIFFGKQAQGGDRRCLRLAAGLNKVAEQSSTHSMRFVLFIPVGILLCVVFSGSSSPFLF